MSAKKCLNLIIVSCLLVLLGVSPVASIGATSLKEGEKIETGFYRFYDDLAIGAPWDDPYIAEERYGVVNVLYGWKTGLSTSETDYLDQDWGYDTNPPEFNDHFGAALAVGDFNNDGYMDLAVGIPGEDLDYPECEWTDPCIDGGMVQVLYGSKSTILIAPNQLFSQAGDMWGTVENHDEFGAALATGDINGDGYDDLAVGVPGENYDEILNDGVVQILYGSSSGLTEDGNQVRYQGSLDDPDDREENDHFGSSLIIGDFDADGYGDLAVGTPDEDVEPAADAGNVYIFIGTADGLSPLAMKVFNQDSPDVAGVVHENDQFGFALDNGDFNGDGFADLAIGAPQDYFLDKYLGSVTVLYGSSTGLPDGDYSDIFYATDIPDQPTMYPTYLGASLAAGDFNGDLYDDLAAGAPIAYRHDTDGDEFNAGVVLVSYGSQYGFIEPIPAPSLTAPVSIPNPEYFFLDTCPVGAEVTHDDQFGTALASGDFNGDWLDDLAIGVPYYDSGYWETNDYGGVLILYAAAASGIDCDDAWLVTQYASPNLGDMNYHDHFGAALAATQKGRKQSFFFTIIMR